MILLSSPQYQIAIIANPLVFIFKSYFSLVLRLYFEPINYLNILKNLFF